MTKNFLWKRALNFLPIIIFIVGLAMYFYQSLTHYIGAGRDDTFIVLWTGTSLSKGYGLVNYNFEPMEISSSLLHTFIVAFINILAPDYIYAINKALGLIAGATLLFILYLNKNILFGRDNLGLTTFGLTIFGLANNRAWLYWNLGGLEVPFQTLIIFVYGLYLFKYWQTPIKAFPLVVLQILYMLIRPEGFLLIFFTIIYLSIRTKSSKPLRKKQLFNLVGLPCFVFISLLIFRYVNFGLLFPTPVYAKIYQGLDQNAMFKFKTGIEYLISFYTSSPYMMIQFVILIAAVIYFAYILFNKILKRGFASQNVDEKFAIWTGLILFNHLFVIAVGGDWMEFYRFIVPIIPFLTILTTIFTLKTFNVVTGKSNSSGTKFRTYANLALIVLLFATIPTNSGQRDNPETQDFHNCSKIISLEKMHSLALDLNHLDENLIVSNCAGKRDWDGTMLFITDELPVLYDSFNHQVTIATFQMGFFPYYIKKMNPTMNIKFIDTLGLADNTIARMHGPRGSYGLIEGTKIVSIFSGKSGPLSEYVLSFNPNMIYVLNATPSRRMAMSKLGWITSWDKPGAVIFTKKYNQITQIPLDGSRY